MVLTKAQIKKAQDQGGEGSTDTGIQKGQIPVEEQGGSRICLQGKKQDLKKTGYEKHDQLIEQNGTNKKTEYGEKLFKNRVHELPPKA